MKERKEGRKDIYNISKRHQCFIDRNKKISGFYVLINFLSYLYF